MKGSLRSILGLGLILCCGTVFGQDEGESLFKQVCFACHRINGGKLVGPDLARVHQRRSEDWLIRFIRSSQSVIQSGDAVAAALFEEHNKLIMPDNNYSDDQIRSILAYIREASGSGSTAPVSDAARSLDGATEEDILSGERLFSGRDRLAAGGPSCSSCHHVLSDRILAGGSLAKDLTEAHSRLGEAGVRAMLDNPPFPAMRQAYLGRGLSEEEIYDLGAFLQQVDRVKNEQRGGSAARALLFPGFGGAALLLLLFGGLRILSRGGRKTRPGGVNRTIFDRQMDTE